MAERAARRQAEDLPEHEERAIEGTEKSGGVLIDLADLEEKDKDKGDKERGAKKGGEDRAEEILEDDGPLDRVGEESDEEVRLRRREERKTRKAERERRERELESRLETTERELQTLRQAAVTGQQQGLRREYESTEAEMARLQVQYRDAKAAKEKAYKDGDASTAVEADEIMASAKDRFASLGQRREEIIRTAQQERTQTQRVSPQLKQHAESFMKDHAWYDIKGGDRDSARVIATDRAMAAEGWDPNTKGYWEELRERLRDDPKLTHRFDEEDDEPERGDGNRGGERQREREQPRRRQTTGGSDRDLGGGRASNQFFLSAVRVAALKEAGMWDDPAKRNKMIKTYKQRDEAEKRRKQGERQ